MSSRNDLGSELTAGKRKNERLEEMHDTVILLCLVHTADTHCLVLSASAVWTELATSQDCRRLKISKQFCPDAKCGVNWVLSCPGRFQFATWLLIVTTESRLVHKCVHTADETRLDKTVQSPIYWGLLKTVCDCRHLSSHRRQDKTRQSCFVGVSGVN